MNDAPARVLDQAAAGAAGASIRVCAVVVCFHPDQETIAGTLESIVGQVDATMVVDNGSSEAMAVRFATLEAAGTIHYRKLASNLGLAAGHNIGIAWARQQGFSHVLLMDQDSQPAPGMVARLASTLRELEADGRRVAAIGPRIVMEAGNTPVFPFIKLGVLNNQHFVNKRRPGSPVEADIVISSGSLIPLSVIDTVGGMDEALFIDNVDVDWCFRAAAHGFELFGDGGTDMQHRLGDGSHRLWFFRPRHVIVHSPLRLYYIMRNRLKLYARPHTPWLWIVQDWYRLGVKLSLFSLLIPPRVRNTRMMVRGLVDGLKGVGGAFPGNES